MSNRCFIPPIRQIEATIDRGNGIAIRYRPIRPSHEWRPGLSLAQRPASTVRHRLSYDEDEIAAFSERLRRIPPHER